MTRGGVDDPAADDLRRRLYRPGATPADLDAYRAAVQRAQAQAAAPEVPPPSPRRRRAGPVLAGLALAAAALGVFWTVAPTEQPAGGAPTATPTADPLSGTGFRALPGALAWHEVSTSGPERAAFVRALTEGGSAGLSLWLDERAPDLPGVLRVATKSETIEVLGDGDRTLRLAPVSLGDDGGHVTVLIVSAIDAEGGWVAARPVTGSGRVLHLTSSAPRAGRLRAGVPVAADFAYLPGQRPTTLRIVLPDGERWGAAVVFSD